MKDKLSTVKTSSNNGHRERKPYWNDILNEQCKKVHESEKSWLRVNGSRSNKRRLKEI